MISIDETQRMLDEIAESLPAACFRHLNGGILLLPEAKRSPYARGDDLYILGEYHFSRALGRLIRIYYGSFARVFPDISPERAREELRRVLAHEMTHHLESLAGEDALARKDAADIARYRATTQTTGRPPGE